MVIVGIQNLNDGPCQVFFLLYGFLVISLVKGIQAENLLIAAHPRYVKYSPFHYYSQQSAYHKNTRTGLVALLNKPFSSTLY